MATTSRESLRAAKPRRITSSKRKWFRPGYLTGAIYWHTQRDTAYGSNNIVCSHSLEKHRRAYKEILFSSPVAAPESGVDWPRRSIALATKSSSADGVRR